MYLLMLGGACPSVTSLIARALPALGLLQVRRASSSSSCRVSVSSPGFLLLWVSGVLRGSAPQPVQQEVVPAPGQHGAAGPRREPGHGEAAAALQVEEGRAADPGPARTR